MLGRASGQWQQHQAAAPMGRGGRTRAEAQGLRGQVSVYSVSGSWHSVASWARPPGDMLGQGQGPWAKPPGSLGSRCCHPFDPLLFQV